MTTPLLGTDYRPLFLVDDGLWRGIAMMLCAGLIVGALARLWTPHGATGGAAASLGLGAAGAVSAGMLGREVGWFGASEGIAVVAGVLGAAIVLWMYRAVATRTTASAR